MVLTDSVLFLVALAVRILFSRCVLVGLPYAVCVMRFVSLWLFSQMLTGGTPFKGSCSDDTFANILSSPLKWPETVPVSSDCKAVVKKLLRREPEKRLGAENGASEIKAARWFAGVNFALIRNEVPPIIPAAKNELAEMSAPAMADDGDDDAALDDRGDQDNPFSDFSLKRDALHRHY